MKFVVSSSDLLAHLQSISKVINSRNTLPILDNFLFKLEGNLLEITASDLETTFITRMQLENASESGAIAIPAKLTEYLSKFPEQPLTFNIALDTYAVSINSETGEFNLMGCDWQDFPQLPKLKQDVVSKVQVPASTILQGISNTIFATGDDELRPVMNGIFLELDAEHMTFVASDSHKLVRYRRSDIKPGVTGAFILPKKPASLLKTVLPKEQGEVEIKFDDKNAVFQLSEYTMVCRLVEGTYPAYNSVIPTNNPNKLIVDRLDFLGSLRRVAMFTNQASNLIKLELKGNQITIFAQDLDFSVSGRDTLKCQYDGSNMNIGFKASFLADILSNLASTDICLEMSDPARASLVLPVQTETEGEDILMLIMPMTVAE